MNSNKTLLVFAILLVAVAVIVGAAWFGGDDVDNSDSVATVTPTPTPSPTPQVFSVHLTAQGMSPKTLTIRSGDSVTFTNDTLAPFWPASDPHPTHILCPGFDASRALQQGETYTLTFTSLKTCTYHDHRDFSNGAHQGTIIVQ